MSTLTLPLGGRWSAGPHDAYSPNSELEGEKDGCVENIILGLGEYSLLREYSLKGKPDISIK